MDELKYLEDEILRVKAEIKRLNQTRKEMEDHLISQSMEILGVSDNSEFFECTKEDFAKKCSVLVEQGADLKIVNILIKEWLKKHKNK